MRALRGVIVLVLALALAAPVLAADLEAGKEAYDRGDYATALNEWLPLAEQGNAVAQSSVAVIYAAGKGVPPDYVLAHMWLNLAAAGFPPGEGRDLAANHLDKVKNNMTPEQIGKARRLADAWEPK